LRWEFHRRQIVEREFRDLDEVLVWIDRNQLGRRNLTDEQRAVVIGRLYKTFKRDPRWNLKQLRRPWDWGWDWEDVEIRQLKLSCRKGGNVTAEIIAKQVGVGQATVRRAEKFTEAVEALQQVSPKAAEAVLRGEVKDALTMLPKVPEDALEFVARKIEAVI